MPANKMSISWETVMPATGLKPNSIYIIDPGVGNLPAVFVTNKTGSASYRINPTPDLSIFIKKINELSPDANGKVQLDLSFTNGILNLSGSGININLDARYLTLTEYNVFKTLTNNRLDSLETSIASGLKTPVAFDASSNSTFPTQTKGFTYKVTVAGITSGINLEVGDTIIYDANGNTPFVVQTNVDNSTETISGLIMIASQTEVNTGSINNKAIVPLTLQTKLNSLIASQVEVDTGTNDTKFVTPLKNKTYFDNQKASQAEVDTGTNDTKFVTPLKLQTKIATALSSVHTHTNKTYLDKIGETATGEMTYNGDAVYTLGSSAW